MTTSGFESNKDKKMSLDVVKFLILYFNVGEKYKIILMRTN